MKVKTFIFLEIAASLVVISFGLGIMITRKYTPVIVEKAPVVQVKADWFLQTSATIYTQAAAILDEKNEEKKLLQLAALQELCELYNKRSSEVKDDWNIKCPRYFTMDYLFNRKRFKQKG